jgi:hypothetical protein
MSNSVKNIKHLLISNKPTVPVFELNGHTYFAFAKAPASVLAEFFSTENRVEALHRFLLGSLTPDDAAKYAEDIFPDLGLSELDELVTIVMEETTPLSDKK